MYGSGPQVSPGVVLKIDDRPTLAKPESTTNLMPSMVTLACCDINNSFDYEEKAAGTSAILVDIITFLEPRSAGSNTLSCSSVVSPACKASKVKRMACRGSLRIRLILYKEAGKLDSRR